MNFPPSLSMTLPMTISLTQTHSHATSTIGSRDFTGTSTTGMASSMLAIPGYLLLNLKCDFRIGEVIAHGGVGVIQAAEAVNPTIIENNGGDTGVAIKFYKDDFRESSNGEFRVSHQCIFVGLAFSLTRKRSLRLQLWHLCANIQILSTFWAISRTPVEWSCGATTKTLRKCC